MKLLRRFGPRLTSHSFFWQGGHVGEDATAETAFAGRPVPHSKVTATIERVWTWIHKTFPERQIYIRSNGRVQFFTFGPSLQATLAGLSLIFLGWVAFATVNVIFKDRIINAKDHRYQEMQTAYETRLTDLQISYDELNGALVGAEDKFKTAADTLQTKQNAIANFLNRKVQVEAAVVPAGPPLPAEKMSAGASMDEAPSDAVAQGGQPVFTSDKDADGGSTLTVMPEPVAPQPRIAKPDHAGLLDQTFTELRHMADAIFTRPAQSPAALSQAYAQHPGLQIIAQQTARVASIGSSETFLMDKTGDTLKGDVASLREIVHRTGINPAQFERQSQASEGVGGPEIPLDRVQVVGLNDGNFDAA